MKLPSIHLLIAIALFSSTSFMPGQKTNQYDCKTIIDSATILTQTGAFGVNTIPTITDEERHLRLSKWFQTLSFKDFVCLLEHENISLKATGFIYSAMLHRDSLLRNYSHLLIDTTTVSYMSANSDRTHQMKLGELLTEMTQIIHDDLNELSKQSQVEDKVSSFIKAYSTYPETYNPTSFPVFSIGSDDKGTSEYKITHAYRIKNNKGQYTKNVHSFIFDKHLRLSVIDKDSSSYGLAFPPRMGYWLDVFGRTLSETDSSNLRLR